MDKGIRGDIAAIGKILGFVRKWKYRYTFGLIVNAASGYVYALLIGLLLGEMLRQAQNTDMAALVRGTLLYSGLILGYLLVTMAARYAFDSAVAHAGMGIRRALFARMTRLPMDSPLNAHSGENIARLDSDAAYSAELLEYTIREPVSLFITLVAGFVTILTIHWICGVALMALGLAFLFIKIKIATLSRKHFSARQARMGRTVAYMSDILTGAQTVRIYNRDAGLLQRFVQACGDLRVQAMRAFKIRTIQNGLGQVEAALAFALSVGIGFLLFFNGRIALSQLPLLLQIGGMFVSAISNIGGFISDMQEGLAGASRVVEVLNMKQEVQPAATELPDGSSDFAIEARNLSAGYEGQPVLRGIDIAIPKGQTWAIVGTSGSGKSTLLKLLMGACNYEGELLVQGVDASKLSRSALRELTAYVPQECPLFEGSIFENIQLGNLNASQTAVEQATRDADLEEFIAGLPDGGQTQVGERGVQLSGGQRQRIAIARAMLKDAPIILLDEITSALDATTETRIQHALERLTRGRTVLVVTHRLYSIQNADHILVLSKGKIAERGSHGELMENSSIYARMASTQIGA